MIDYNILLRELEKLSVSPVLIRWIAAFLTNRQQAVKIEDTTSEWRTVKGGIPQGTKLGVILFAVMTNGLIADWPLRIKFVDDTVMSLKSLFISTSQNINLHKCAPYNHPAPHPPDPMFFM